MSNRPHIEPLTCTVAEFCQSVAIGKTHFYAEKKAGRIKVLKSGRKTLVPLSEREAYLARLANAAGADARGNETAVASTR